jgi:hypothetical protein
MSRLAASFTSLPPEYLAVIRLAQEQHGISITPLQELLGGWSGAMVYLVSVAFKDSKPTGLRSPYRSLERCQTNRCHQRFYPR